MASALAKYNIGQITIEKSWALFGGALAKYRVAKISMQSVEGPKARMAKKWSGNGFGPSQMTCPKSVQKVPKKLSKNGLSRIWDHVNTNLAWVFDK